MQQLLSSARYVLLLAGLAALIASSMIGAGIAPARANTLVTLRVAMPAPTRLDPVRLSRFDPYTRDLVENLFVGLTRFDPVTQEVKPMIAESWTVSADGLTWMFQLRDDVQWVRYDTVKQAVVAVRPVAAGDFVYAIQRACDPLRPSPVTANLMIIQGCHTVAHAFPEIINDLFLAREIGVRATGPNTLEINLLYPAAYLPSLLSTPELRPLAREAESALTGWTAADRLITNGPYVLQNWEASGMTLVQNPHWPDSYAGNVEQVEVVFSGETVSAPRLVTGQRADLARVEADQNDSIRTTYPELFRTGPGTSLVMLGFSYDRAMVDTREVRHALASAIDRDALVSQLLPGQAQAATQFTPPGVVAAPSFDGITFDQGQAQTHFSTAGFAGCDSVPEKLILLVPDDDPLWTNAGQFITQQWSTWLGCNPALLEVKPLPRVTMIELSHSAYDPEQITRSHMWLVVWSADYPDANAWIADALHCRYGYIRTGRACDGADALLDQAALEMDATTRADLYTQAEGYFFGPDGTFPVIPLFVMTASWVQQPWLTEVNTYGAARFDLWQIDVETQITALAYQ